MKKYLSNYKKYDPIYEMYLRSEFKFGFELEGIYQDPQKYDRFKNETEKFFGTGGRWDWDVSVNNDLALGKGKRGGKAFEYASDILDFIPLNADRLIKILSSLENYGIYTNSSCGLHIHTSWPNIKEDNMFWVYLNLAVDKDMLKSLMTFKKYKFYTLDRKGEDVFSHASSRIFKELQSDIRTITDVESLSVLSDFFTTEKTNMLRLHPLGTLEWRGPRGFLDKQIHKEIVGFVQLLYKWVDFIRNTLDKDSIVLNGNKFSRDDINNSLSDYSLVDPSDNIPLL